MDDDKNVWLFQFRIKNRRRNLSVLLTALLEKRVHKRALFDILERSEVGYTGTETSFKFVYFDI